MRYYSLESKDLKEQRLPPHGSQTGLMIEGKVLSIGSKGDSWRFLAGTPLPLQQQQQGTAGPWELAPWTYPDLTERVSKLAPWEWRGYSLLSSLEASSMNGLHLKGFRTCNNLLSSLCTTGLTKGLKLSILSFHELQQNCNQGKYATLQGSKRLGGSIYSGAAGLSSCAVQPWTLNCANPVLLLKVNRFGGPLCVEFCPSV